jgi:hypothetical protein
MPTKPKLSRQDLMAFFQDIMQGEALMNGENAPSMEQRMKAAVTLMALLEKHPEDDDGLITFKVAPHQIDAMQEALYRSWRHTQRRPLRRRGSAFSSHQGPSFRRENPVERGPDIKETR